LRGAG
jgi:hypothetical protein